MSGDPYRIHLGDNLVVLRSFKRDTFDSIVTDPPYGLGMMGKNWDTFSPDVVKQQCSATRVDDPSRARERLEGLAGRIAGDGRRAVRPVDLVEPRVRGVDASVGARRAARREARARTWSCAGARAWGTA